MVPLSPDNARRLRSRFGEVCGPGLLALPHALDFPRAGLWGDDAERPRSVVLLREGDGRREAFGAGDPSSAIGWLARQPGSFTMLAPGSWEGPLRAAVGPLGRSEVLTYTYPGPAHRDAAGRRPSVPTRRLTLDDAAAFAATAPAWALRGWRSFEALIAHGAGFGVSHGRGFAALAWVFDQAGDFDAIGVSTMPRFRRLGLGRATASALIGHILQWRGKVPLWSTTPANAASRALANSLGLSLAATESLLHWGPAEPATSGIVDPTNA